MTEDAVAALAFLLEKMVEVAGDETRVTARFWTRLPFNRSSTVALYAIADQAGMACRRDAGARPVMSAFTSRVMPDNLALLRVLEATIEILKTENEILKRRLASAAQAVITKRLDTLAAKRLDALAAERARPWWRRLAG